MILLFLWLVASSEVKPLTVDEFLARPKSKDADELTGQAFVDYINEQQPFYKAEYSPDAERFVKARIMDIKFSVDPDRTEPQEPVSSAGLKADLPKSFDAREHWPKCAKTLRYIRDQSSCGSCWAVAATSVMSDIACIQSNGRISRHFSDTEVLSCCSFTCGFGCGGGWPSRAFGYAYRNGISTGGPYREKNACQPYAFYPCGRHQNQTYYGPCPRQLWRTPTCRKTCQLGYHVPFEKDKIYNKEVEYVRSNETFIRQHIMEKGPVVAVYDVYQDFSYHKKGIYIQKWGAMTGAHAVRIIGWGEENEVPYWLVANSWNTDWGENGYFRILRGKNHCNIESQVVSGILNV